MRNDMNRLLPFLVLAVASVPSVFGQDATTPHSPVIVKRLVLLSQTASIGSYSSPVPLFTPDHDGFYRITGIVQAVGQPASCVAVCVSAGIETPQGGGVMVLSEGPTGNSVSFLGTAGQPALSYYVIVLPTNTEPYDLVIVIEEL
jgi:hypothetical protein